MGETVIASPVPNQDIEIVKRWPVTGFLRSLFNRVLPPRGPCRPLSS